MMTSLLTSEGLADYREHGLTIVPGVFSHEECDALIEHMMDWQSGRKTIEGMSVREPDDWGRTLNQHFRDPVALQWLLDPRLRPMLHDCLRAEPAGVQTMYFFKGSTQGRHQDQYYLPACMSAWIALGEVDQDNGTIWVQKGSHQKHLLMAAELDHASGQDFSNGEVYHEELEKIFEHNATAYGCKEVPAEAKKGDVVLFHGIAIHRGGPIGVPGSFRHVLANHYVPESFEAWPYGQWPRYGFDGTRHADTDESEGYPLHPNEVTNFDAVANQQPVY